MVCGYHNNASQDASQELNRDAGLTSILEKRHRCTKSRLTRYPSMRILALNIHLLKYFFEPFMSSTRRPLSPHLNIYRPQITSVLSILHRITGVILGLGSVFLAVWIAAITAGPESYQTMRLILGSWWGFLGILGFGFALYYHLFNGIRHLVWDMGYGFSLKSIAITGWIVVVLSVAATSLTGWAAFEIIAQRPEGHS